jgi:hypothetical protein
MKIIKKVKKKKKEARLAFKWRMAGHGKPMPLRTPGL